MRGSEAHDEIEPGLRRATNRAGGIEGGRHERRACRRSRGDEAAADAHAPAPLGRPRDRGAGEALVERSDVQAVEALAVVAEAAVAWELARAAREKFGGDALVDFVAAHARVPGAHRLAATRPERAGSSRRARRLHGRGEVDARPELAERLGRPFVSVDAVVEERAGLSVAEIFEARGEPAFRELEEEAALDVLPRGRLAVVEIGGGGLASAADTRRARRARVHAPSGDDCRRGVGARRRRAGVRSPATETRSGSLFEERGRCTSAADGTARDLDGAVLAAAGVTSCRCARPARELVPAGRSSWSSTSTSTRSMASERDGPR